MRRACLALALLFLAACSPGCRTQAAPLAPAEAKLDLPEAYARTVKIESNCPGHEGTGSGVILTQDAAHLVVATANHVVPVSECKVAVVRFDGTRFNVFRIRVDARHDVTVLYTIDGELDHTKWLGLPVMRPAVLAENIVTTGFPYDRLLKGTIFTVTLGNVAVDYADDDESRYRITAPIMYGSSGGPCWGSDGALVGLTVSIYQDRGIILDGHGYLTAAEHIQALLE